MKPVICIGAAIIDDSFHCLNEPLPGTSNPATHLRSAGGVARNVAHPLAQLGNPVELISHFGLDGDGVWLKEKCLSAGIGLSNSRFTRTGTGRFVGIISPSGELFAGASDTHTQEEITIAFLSERTLLLESASLILCDCNLAVSSIGWLLDFCRTHSVPCVIEPVSAAKASLLRDVNLKNVLLITPNNAELAGVCGRDANDEQQSLAERLLEKGVQNIWIRKGKEGSEMFSREGIITLPAPDVEVADTTGAGDAALAGWIHAWLRKMSAREWMMYGHAMAEIILRTRGAHADHLDSNLLESTVANLRIQ